MDHFLKNWKTTTISIVLTLGPYILQYFGFWPSAIPLPPFDQAWSSIAGVIGVGAMAKDFNSVPPAPPK